MSTLLIGCSFQTGEGGIDFITPKSGPYNVYSTYNKSQDSDCSVNVYDSIDSFRSNISQIIFNIDEVLIKDIAYIPGASYDITSTSCQPSTKCGPISCNYTQNRLFCETRSEVRDNITYTEETDYVLTGTWTDSNTFNGYISVTWSCRGDCSEIQIIDVNNVHGHCEGTIHVEAVYAL